jgi:hypothetical protein
MSAILILAFWGKGRRRLARKKDKYQRLISGRETTGCGAVIMSFSSKPGGMR